MNNQTFLIGIAGGTGSGKTSIANAIVNDIDDSKIVLIQQDSYYRDLMNLTMEERSQINYDHPNAMDFDLMKDQLTNLIKGNPISVPEYDYKTHTRTQNSRNIKNPTIIIIEGILALYDPDIRNLMNLKIYIDVADDIRIIRRIRRDVNKRMRSLSSIVKQYYNTVRPMHNQFVETTKKYADIIIPNGKENIVAIEILRSKIMSIIYKMEIDN